MHVFPWGAAVRLQSPDLSDTSAVRLQSPDLSDSGAVSATHFQLTIEAQIEDLISITINYT